MRRTACQANPPRDKKTRPVVARYDMPSRYQPRNEMSSGAGRPPKKKRRHQLTQPTHSHEVSSAEKASGNGPRPSRLGSQRNQNQTSAAEMKKLTVILAMMITSCFKRRLTITAICKEVKECQMSAQSF